MVWAAEPRDLATFSVGSSFVDFGIEVANAVKDLKRLRTNLCINPPEVRKSF